MGLVVVQHPGCTTGPVRSVLRVADQDRGAFPDRCVLTGAPTAGAVRVRAVAGAVPELVGDALGGLVAFGPRISLPVDEQALRSYRRRQAIWLTVVALGAGAVGAGLVRSGATVLGALLVAGGLAGQAWTRRRRWVQVRGWRGSRDIVVLRTNPEFDRQARRLFTASLGVRNAP